MSLVAIGAVLFALLLLGVAAMVWQETRGSSASEITYVIEEAVPFAFARLSDDASAALDRDDVLRILEWEVRYLQGLDIPRHHLDHPAPVAGSAAAVDFILESTANAGRGYERRHVEEVLEHEAAYLADIGAVGGAVEEAS